MKSFLISIDTEGDNLWKWKTGDDITTENASYLERFQIICNEFGFKPTYLVNYEMAKSREFVTLGKKYLNTNEAEIGMHLHAWNTPPEYSFSTFNSPKGAPYLIEYPYEIMEQKISNMTSLLEDTFGVRMETHRAGRWATTSQYFELLKKFGYRYDCSITPHVNWKNHPGESEGSFGSDYSRESEKPHVLIDGPDSLFEIPCTVRLSHKVFLPEKTTFRSFASSFYHALSGNTLWLRPDGKNLKEMLWLLSEVAKDPSTDYIMFMLHSSEFMPGGSPTFKTEESIEKLFHDIRVLFSAAAENFKGKTIKEYGRRNDKKSETVV